MGDALQGGGILQLVKLLRGDFAFYHLEIQPDQPLGVGHLAPLDKVDHQRCRRLRDGAAAADKPCVLNDAVGNAQLQGDIIAAAGVDPLQAVGCPRHGVAVGGAAAVFGYNLGVQFVQVHKPITFLTFSRFCSRASMSCGVLYRATLARQQLPMPRYSISGWAQ